MVASQDWPEVTKYAGLVCAQAHRQELIQDLFKTWVDPQRGQCTGGMIKYTPSLWAFVFSLKWLGGNQVHHFLFWRRNSCSFFNCSNYVPVRDRELLISFRKATGQKPLRIIFYRFVWLDHILQNFCVLVGVLSQVSFVVIDWCLVYISNVYLGVVSKKPKKVQPESSAVFGAGVLLGTPTSENRHSSAKFSVSK